MSPLEWFDPDLFVPRGQCGHWLPFFRGLYFHSHLAICLSYLVISLTLFRSATISPRASMTIREIKVSKIIFAVFIACCAMGHLFDGVVAFVWPNYHFFAVWHALTALVSLVAACWTFKMRTRYLLGL